MLRDHTGIPSAVVFCLPFMYFCCFPGPHPAGSGLWECKFWSLASGVGGYTCFGRFFCWFLVVMVVGSAREGLLHKVGYATSWVVSRLEWGEEGHV